MVNLKVSDDKNIISLNTAIIAVFLRYEIKFLSKPNDKNFIPFPILTRTLSHSRRKECGGLSDKLTGSIIKEGVNRSSILSSENVNGETIIFYEGHNALGVASIAESPKGYSWYRSQAYTGFQGQDVPYMTVGF